MQHFAALTLSIRAVGNLFWIAVYVLALLRGSTDKTYAIPLPAIVVNVVWNLLYSTIFAVASPVGPYITIVWLVLNMALFLQALRYWRHELLGAGSIMFASFLVVGCSTCLGILYFAQLEGVEYVVSPFPKDLMLSILFIEMLFTRDNARGQSLYVAIFKMIGTSSGIAAGMFSVARLSRPEIATGIATLFFDFLYIILLYEKLHRLGFQPWKRL